jgi:hypothetical protein
MICRTCPRDVSWFTFPTTNNVAHLYESVECSSMGICDRALGTCACKTGFTGAACEFMDCPGILQPCNGRGQCLDMATLATTFGTQYGIVPNNPYTWDAKKVMGCLCDYPYTGYDCSLYQCPLGDDPMTINQVNEIRQISCKDADNSGTVILQLGRFISKLPLKPTSTLAQVKAAIENIDFAGVVKVTNTTGFGTLCSSSVVSTLQIEFLSLHGTVPLYNNRTKVNALFGRGYIAGIDQRDQRKGSNFILSLTEKRLSEKASEEDQNRVLTDKEKLERTKARDQMMEALKKRHEAIDDEKHSSAVNSSHWSSKSLEKMTERDWRIFREDFDIRIQGGRATLPLRYWAEAKFPDPVLHAIKDAGYENPSPIQRQAIPVGLAHRDMIGIAETGSGKTAAFAIPLLCFLANSPEERLRRCADEGPLAIVMAPTRELAQQIYEECCKLAKHTNFSACCVVGGQSIEQQGFRLRQGVHIVIGTPGRLCDCLQNNYLVLNQCSYVVLDEADRMVDMGFEPQVVEVLDAMGGLLKSEDEDQAEQQIQGSTSNYRVTAMVSLRCIFDFVSIRYNSCWLCV